MRPQRAFTEADRAALEAAARRRQQKIFRASKGFPAASVGTPLEVGEWVTCSQADPATGLEAGKPYKITAIRESVNPRTPCVRVALFAGFPPQGSRRGALVFDGYKLELLTRVPAPE